MRAMRIHTALVVIVLLSSLLLTSCDEEQEWKSCPTPTPTSTPVPAVQPIPWEFPLWSEVLGDIEGCIPDEGISITKVNQSASGLEVRFGSSGSESYESHLYEYVLCLEALGNYSVNVPSKIPEYELRHYIEIEVNKDYTLYVDGKNVWHYPVYNPASSHILIQVL